MNYISKFSFNTEEMYIITSDTFILELLIFLLPKNAFLNHHKRLQFGNLVLKDTFSIARIGNF